MDALFVGGILKESTFSSLHNCTFASFRVFVPALNVDDKNFSIVYNVIYANLKINKSSDYMGAINVV